MTSPPFTPADILLPDGKKTDMTRFSCIACDQFTSEPAYWEAAADFVGQAPSALHMILPECYLEKPDEPARILDAQKAMRAYEKDVLTCYKESMIYVRRTDSVGQLREGLVGKIDLEDYDYRPGSVSPIRATEGTVLSRIPPRLRVRQGATLELPHVMLLFCDKTDRLFSFLRTAALPVVYDFDLMLGGGHSEGRLLTGDLTKKVSQMLLELTVGQPFAFAVGDGNHSLATAKAMYEECKRILGDEAAAKHPCRYALVELVNLFDTSLVFEPIYRLVQGVDPEPFLTALTAFSGQRQGDRQVKVRAVSGTEEWAFSLPCREAELPVGVLQEFLDAYVAEHPQVALDYIHGEDSLRALASEQHAIGFLFEGMRKEQLFDAVAQRGSLPRKTFSMGHARDKRYYLECRRIKPSDD